MSLIKTDPPLVATAEPPFHGPKINVGGWWGCPDWLIKGEPTRAAMWDWEKEMPPKMREFLDLCEEATPGEPVAFGPTRLTAEQGARGHWALVSLDVSDSLAVQPIYLAFVEAVAEPAQWRWLDVGHGVLAALDSDDGLCAFIAPARKGRRR